MRERKNLILRDFHREHLERRNAYPEGFLPDRQSDYDVHQTIAEITPELLLWLLDQLPANFCDATDTTFVDITCDTLAQSIEKFDKSIIITQLSISSAWTDSKDIAHPAKVTLTAHIFFPGVVSVSNQANIVGLFSSTINWDALTNNAAEGIIPLQVSDSSAHMPVTITLPKTRIATAEEHRAYIIENMPMLQRLTDMQGQRFIDVTGEMPSLVQSSQDRPGRYMITSKPAAVLDNDALQKQVLEYQQYFGKVVEMARGMAIEISRQNKMSTELLRCDIVSGILPQEPGVFSDLNIKAFFEKQKKV